MSVVLVVSVTVVLLLAFRPVQPVAAFARVPTLGADRHRATSGIDLQTDWLMRATRLGAEGPPTSRRSARARGYRDPLQPHRATMGPDVRTSMLARLRAVILLLLIIAVIGAAIAGVTLLVIASGRFFLELLAG